MTHTITEARYANAEETAVLAITTEAGAVMFAVSDPPVEVFTSGGGTIADYVAPPATPPHLNHGGLARFTGTTPPNVLENIRMAGVTRVSKGRYRVTHETPMPSDQYSVMPSVMDANPRTIRYTARTANHVEVRVTDLAGAAQDPTEITIKTERVITPS